MIKDQRSRPEASANTPAPNTLNTPPRSSLPPSAPPVLPLPPAAPLFVAELPPALWVPDPPVPCAGAAADALDGEIATVLLTPKTLTY